MKNGYHGNIILIELIIVLLFFSIASTLSIGVFVKARQTENDTAYREEITQQSSDLAAAVYGSETPEEILAADGWVRNGDAYTLNTERAAWTCVILREETAAGMLVTLQTDAAPLDASSGSEAAHFESVYYLPKEVDVP